MLETQGLLKRHDAAARNRHAFVDARNAQLDGARGHRLHIRDARQVDDIAAVNTEEAKVAVRNIRRDGNVFLKKEEKKKPLIMARLLNVESLLSSMVCKEEMDLEFVLYDPVIRENNRLFMLKGNEEHLVVRTRTAHTGKDDAVQKISIDALTSIVFGYKELEKIEEEEKEIFSAEFKEEISKLMPFSPVFINEIV